MTLLSRNRLRKLAHSKLTRGQNLRYKNFKMMIQWTRLMKTLNLLKCRSNCLTKCRHQVQKEIYSTKEMVYNLSFSLSNQRSPMRFQKLPLNLLRISNHNCLGREAVHQFCYRIRVLHSKKMVIRIIWYCRTNKNFRKGPKATYSHHLLIGMAIYRKGQRLILRILRKIKTMMPCSKIMIM